MLLKVFKALFGGKFAEAQSIRDGDGPHEVKITDSLKAMTLMCKLLHMQNPEVFYNVTLLVDFAVLVDKYDCVEALRSASFALLSSYPRDTPTRIDNHFPNYSKVIWGDVNTTENLITAAYILDQPELFRRFTRNLILHCDIPPRFDHRCTELLPSDLLRSLQAQESFARREFSHHVSVLVHDYGVAARKLGRAYMVTELMAALEGLGVWPLAHHSILSMEDSVRFLGLVKLLAVLHNGDGSTPAIDSPDLFGRWAMHLMCRRMLVDVNSVDILAEESQPSTPMLEHAAHGLPIPDVAHQRHIDASIEYIKRLCSGV